MGHSIGSQAPISHSTATAQPHHSHSHSHSTSQYLQTSYGSWHRIASTNQHPNTHWHHVDAGWGGYVAEKYTRNGPKTENVEVAVPPAVRYRHLGRVVLTRLFLEIRENTGWQGKSLDQQDAMNDRTPESMSPTRACSSPARRSRPRPGSTGQRATRWGGVGKGGCIAPCTCPPPHVWGGMELRNARESAKPNPKPRIPCARCAQSTRHT